MSAEDKWQRRSYRAPTDYRKRPLLHYIYRRLKWSLGARSPYFAYLKLTRRCNLDCSYCPWHTGPVNADEELSTLQWKRVIDRLAEMGIEVLVLEGGEPTLRTDLSDLLRHAHSLGLAALVGTNGTTNPWRLRPTAFTVSIDGPKEIHDSIRGSGSFDRLIANLQTNPGLPVASITVVTRANVDYLENMLQEIMPYVTCAGFTFQYPYSSRSEVLLNPGEAANARAKLLDLKRDARFRILNPTITLKQKEWTCYPEIAVTVSHLGMISSGCFVEQVEPPRCDDCQLACYRLLAALHTFNFEAWFTLYRHLLRYL